MGRIKGYKVFGPGWVCDPAGTPFRYEVGKTYEMEECPIVCKRGFHFCEQAINCFKYYEFNPKNKVAEVEAIGIIDSDESKSCTNKIHIVREITWHELLDIVNTGSGCTGIGNSGNCNSGGWNSGNCNSGGWNSGNCNSGGWNSGDCNSGNCNSGDCNSGNRNSGDWNSGDCNSGNRNSGGWNSGNCNSGDRNSGNCNSGDWNSGDCNSGDWNSGDWNTCNHSNGCFNTHDQNIYLFNKPSNWTYNDWFNSRARKVLERIANKCLTYVIYDKMSDQEKEQHPEAKTTGGYLKVIDNPDVQRWWVSLSDDDKKVILGIPNFDKAIFKEITGIDIDKN